MNASELTGEAARGAERLLGPLSAEARDLVSESFEPVSFPFGAVIVREGEEPDGVYMLAEGSARVVKDGVHGGEVALRSLGPGDWFGALAVLDHAPRQASVRASDEVVAWRLERQLFLALLHSHPEIRSSFEALARRHATEDFLLLYSSFSKLPPEALDRLADALERVDVSAGDVVLSEGDPPGPMFVIEQGHFRAYRRSEGEEQDLEYLRTGDFFGELALHRSEPQAASVAAVSDGRLLRLRREDFDALSAGYPEFRGRIEDRVAHHDFHHLAKVPLDFAQEILPAAAGHEHVSEEQAEPLADPTTAAAAAFEGAEPAEPDARTEAAAAVPARLPARRGGLRRRVPRDGLPLLRQEGRALADPRGRPHLDGRDEPGRDHRGRRRSSGSPRGRCARRRAGWTSCRCRRSSTGRATTGSSSTRSGATASATRTRSTGSGASRAPSSSSGGAGTRRSSPTPSASRTSPSSSTASPGSGRSSALTAGHS